MTQEREGRVENTLSPRHSEFNAAFSDDDEWYTPGDPPRRHVAVKAQQLLARMERRTTRSVLCPFCRLNMRVCGRPPSDPELWEEGDSDLIGFGLEWCPRCAHWRFWSANHACMDWPQYAAAVSVAGRFQQELPEGCASELARALRQRPALWHAVDPIGLERFVTEIFRANYAPCEAQHVGRTGDGGIDVVLVTSGGVRWLIQVKRRGSVTKRESVTTVRELLGSMVDADGKAGMVVSTATAFSQDAIELAKRQRPRGFIVKLIHRDTLDLMLGPLIPRRPWQNLLSHPYLAVAAPEIRPIVEETLKPDQLTIFE